MTTSRADDKSFPQDGILPEFFDAFDWAMENIEGTSFGEVGVSFVLHEGTIVRVKRILETSRKPHMPSGGHR